MSTAAAPREIVSEVGTGTGVIFVERGRPGGFPTDLAKVTLGPLISDESFEAKFTLVVLLVNLHP
jgi:hypothetical protein